MTPRILPLPLLLLATAVAAQTPPAAEQQLRQDLDLVLTRLAASGALGADPQQVNLRVEQPARRVADLGVLVDSGNAERAHDGLRVLGTTPGSAAAQAGLRPGDVIVAVNGVSLRQLGADADGHALAAATLRATVAAAPDGEPLRLELLRDGRRLVVNAPVQGVVLPAMRVELGAAALAAVSGDADAAASGGCGRLSTFDVAPRGEHQYHARILLLDGSTPGPTGHETYRVRAGTHKLLVAEDIPTAEIGVGAIASLRNRHDTHKELTVTVKPNTTLMIAAQLHLDKATDTAHAGYWDPVAWREIAETCP
jgi:hypothetical protein